MKFDFELLPEKPRWVWEKWFAWFPVFTRVRHGKYSLIWLQYVDRMYTGPVTGYEYANDRNE